MKKTCVFFALIVSSAFGCGSVSENGDGDGDGDGDGVTLTVELAGGGAGSVVSDPAGIDCGSTCSASFPAGTQVTLTPTAAVASGFDGWQGECTGLGPCVVTLDAAATVTATFEPGGTVRSASQLGGDLDDFGFRMATDSDGNVLIAGTFRGTVNYGGNNLTSVTDPNGGSSADVFVAKFDPDLVHIWSVGFGSAGGDEINGLAADADGNVLISGGYAGAINFDGNLLNHVGSFDAYVAKLSGATGAAIWADGYSGAGPVRTHGLAVNSENDVVVSFYFKGTASFGGAASESSVGDDDIVIAKYSGQNGAHVWSNRFGSPGVPGGPADDQAPGITVDSADNIYISGTFFGSLNLGGPNNLVQTGTNRDQFIARYDTDGNHSWSRAHASSDGIFTGLGAATDANGDFVIGGRFAGTANFGGNDFTSADDLDIYIAKFSSVNGSHIWSKHYPGAGFKTPRDIEIFSNGDVGAVGFYSLDVDFDGTLAPNATRSNMFVVRLAGASGDLQWLRSFGDQQGAGGIVGRSMAIAPNDRFYATGSLSDTVNFGPGNDFTSTPAQDIVVVEMVP